MNSPLTFDVDIRGVTQQIHNYNNLPTAQRDKLLRNANPLQITPQPTTGSNNNDPLAQCAVTESNRKRILIIATGGTIVMSTESDDVNNAVVKEEIKDQNENNNNNNNNMTSNNNSSPGFLRPQRGFVHKTLSSFHEVKHRDMPQYEILEWPNPIDSSDVTPDDICRLALQIRDNYYSYDGFVVLTGTDTMAYISSQLSFLFENLSKTIVLTGSMIPLNEPVSDAKRNLLVSMLVAANLGIQEVLVFFNTHLLRGNRAKKTDPARIAAFESPSSRPIASMGVGISVNTTDLLPQPSRKFHVHTRLFTNIAVITMTPSFSYSSLRALALHWREYQNVITQTVVQDNEECLDGQCSKRYNTYPRLVEPPAVVLLLYGTGNAPVKHKEFVETLDLLLQEECPVVVLSQCLRGSTSLETYEGGHFLKSKGVIDGLDMTVEACTAKLGYLMGRGLRGHPLKSAMEMNLRGELTKKESIGYGGYSIGTGTPSELARL